MKDIQFWGDSVDVIRAFPDSARQQVGYQLDRVQRGLQPDDFKPMRSVGQGVEEIRIREEGNAYRVIYIARLEDAVHVLHAFEKKARETAQRDLDLAKRRLKQLLATRR
ncbi:type II toxin-antitoxin system RelE/ParE family toxin [Ectothiorhodospiraceae bacterium WFHF3C12]|nr:type II toxin-antitoxin system RelE/ParE family toxin [Ectothiorhodospiraceae bacterium WFHF3C12]